MAVPAVSFTVELQLSADEFPDDHPERDFGAKGKKAEQWKSYPYGWNPPPEFTRAHAASAAEDMKPTILAECESFVRQQYRTGDAPLAWRIKDRSGEVIQEGTSPC